MKKLFKGLMLLVVSISLVACSSGTDEKKIILLKGQFSEITIIQEMAKILIENNTDLKVEYHDSMNTVAAAQTLVDKDVDLYVSYDGTLLSTIMQNDPSNAPKDHSIFDFANEIAKKDKNIFLLDKFGFENTYALAIPEAFAKKNNIKTMSDLVKYSDQIVFGAEHEFFDEEGSIRYKPMVKAYGFNFKDSKSLDINLKYAAIDSNSVQAIITYSTDGLNKKSNLRVLKDDRKFFPEYNAGFLLRTSLFEEYKDIAPNLKEVLSKLTNQISNKEMIELNYRVDANNENPSDVARDFLESKNIK